MENPAVQPIVIYPDTPPLGRGRRRVLNEGAASERLVMRLTPYEYSRVQVAAASRGQTAAALGRTALAQLVGGLEPERAPDKPAIAPEAKHLVAEIGRVGGLLKLLLTRTSGIEQGALRSALANHNAVLAQVRRAVL